MYRSAVLGVYLYPKKALTLCLLPYSGQKLQYAWPIWLCVISQPFYDEVEQVEDLQAKPCQKPSETWELCCNQTSPHHAHAESSPQSHRSVCSRSVVPIHTQ